MGRIDRRRPAEVTASFRARLAERLEPLGFTTLMAAFVRKSGKAVQRVELGSSHYNGPGDVACRIALALIDKTVAPDWRTGGGLSYEPFADELDENIADSANADALIELVLARLSSFFALLDDPSKALLEVQRRYVQGFHEPRVIVPYLRARLGDDAVRSYARALLSARHELLPSWLGPLKRANHYDHGGELKKLVPDLVLELPKDTVAGHDPAAGHLRASFGLQLRAWGEPEAARRLRTLDDATLEQLHEAQEKLDARVDSLPSVQLLLDALGERRAPARAAPEPRHWQYEVRHPPFA